ncbi:Leucine-rich-repeats and calponin homology domain protein [Strongyloides ratti]|uniref:Leucine-rich-repeats and calponin homology domain protein n=1 Tax=Strongyloides ratti TaxID=34506 RepID=A0A090LQQ0_STRRB|nr:Leucine-rich-repeats and calponin homology domain protein [Strongyloides ratti]CEF70506.1 Leucine-rich-repeats and calponin homology domain protein [Strongyloides ratti]
MLENKYLFKTATWLTTKRRTAVGGSTTNVTSTSSTTSLSPNIPFTNIITNTRLNFNHSLNFLQSNIKNPFILSPDKSSPPQSTPIENIIQDAHYSGALLLRARKLTDFPDYYAGKYSLEDVVFVDMTDNRLTEIPQIIIERMKLLETLILAKNIIKILPTSMKGFNSLNYLDLSSNNLTTIPSAIFSLPLQILLLSNNKLDTVSGDIVQMAPTIQELDFSKNRITSITSNISLLKQLRKLNLRSNRLGALPSEMASLELYSLDISANRLTHIPVEFCSMQSLIHLNTLDNPLLSPPIEIALKGREHIFKYLQSAISSDVDYRGNYTDWSTNRNSFINATIRRPKNAEKVAAKAKRFAALNSSDSGYTSTGDDPRHSYDMEFSRNSLASIDENNKKENIIINSDSNGALSNEDEGVDLTNPLKDVRKLNLIEECLDINNSNNNNNNNEINMDTSLYTNLASVTITDSTYIKPGNIIVKDKEPVNDENPDSVLESTSPTSSESHSSLSESMASLSSPDVNNSNLLIDSSNVKENSNKLMIPSPTTNKILKPPSKKVTSTKVQSKLSLPSTGKSTLLVKKEHPVSKLLRPSITAPSTATRISKLTPPKKSISMSSSGSSTPSTPISPSNDNDIDLMKKLLGSKLSTITKEEEISKQLSSGVLLCNFVNKLKPRTIPVVMASLSPSQPVPLPKAKKNAENFVNTAKKLGLSENNLPTPDDIVGRRNLNKIASSIVLLNKLLGKKEELTNNKKTTNI